MPVREGAGMESAEGVRERVMAWTLGGGEGNVSWWLEWGDSGGERCGEEGRGEEEEWGKRYPWKVPARTR